MDRVDLNPFNVCFRKQKAQLIDASATANAQHQYFFRRSRCEECRQTQKIPHSAAEHVSRVPLRVEGAVGVQANRGASLSYLVRFTPLTFSVDNAHGADESRLSIRSMLGSGVAPSPIALARRLPSSTPHWSNALMFHSAASVKTLCS